MKHDRGETPHKWAGIGNTLLFVAVLGLMLYKISQGEYQFAMAIALAGIYAEAWNYRVSEKKERGEQRD